MMSLLGFQQLLYLVWWKRFTAEHNIQERKEDMDNMKEVVAEFERKMNTEVR